jgi:hypothetical protein
MVETLVHCFRGNLLPSGRVVTGLASLGKATVVGIAVTVRAFPERNSRVTQFIVRSRRVALRARNLTVQSGQRILCLQVVELTDGDVLPVGIVMALQAIRTQSSLVLVLMASSAGSGNSEERLTQIFDFNLRALRRRNAIRCMTPITSQSCVLALKSVSRLLVIETLGIPLDQREILSVVLRMAASAFLARAWFDVIGRMQPLMGGNPGRNLAMAIEAFKGCRGS